MPRSRRRCAVRPELIAPGFTRCVPWYGHAEHFHVQLACPADSAECKPPAPPLASDCCGSELDFWFKESTLHPPLRKPKPVLTLAGLPPACKQIIKAP